MPFVVPTNTPAGPSTTAAVQVYAGLGPNHAHRFLGWGKTSPRFQYRYGWIPFFSDLGGPVIPLDEVYAGQEAYVSIDLNFFRQDTLFALESVPNVGVNSWGGNLFGEIGSLMGFEGLLYPLTLVFPNFAKPPYKAQGMPPGLRFYNCLLVGPSGYRPGNEPEEINIIWKAKQIINRKTLGFSFRSNSDLSGLPAAA